MFWTPCNRESLFQVRLGSSIAETWNSGWLLHICFDGLVQWILVTDLPCCSGGDPCGLGELYFAWKILVLKKCRHRPWKNSVLLGCIRYASSGEIFIPACMERINMKIQVYGVQRLRRDIHHMGLQTSRCLIQSNVVLECEQALALSLTWFHFQDCSNLLGSHMALCLPLSPFFRYGGFLGKSQKQHQTGLAWKAQVDYTPASEGEYLFPLWANAIGWCIALSSVLAVLPASALEVQSLIW